MGQRSVESNSQDQSWRVTEILKAYDLKGQFVVVTGDLNEDSSSTYQSLRALFDVEGLTPLVDPTALAEDRYTYYYGGAKKGERLSQLDYMFLLEPLRKTLVDQGFERRGIFNIEAITAKASAPVQKGFPEITTWNLGASDHAGLWAEFDISARPLEMGGRPTQTRAVSPRWGRALAPCSTRRQKHGRGDACP